MSQILHGAGDFVESPGWILASDPHDELFDFICQRRTAWVLLAAITVIPLLRNQLPMPTEDRVRRDDRGKFLESLATKNLPLRGQPSALVVVERDPFLAEFFLEHLILRSQVLDRSLLFSVDPASENQQQELPGPQDIVHRRPHGEAKKIHHVA